MAKRKIRKRPVPPAHEYVVLVGAPCNTFNGYFYHDPTLGDVPSPAPADTSPNEISRYIHGPTLQHNPLDPTGTHDLYWANYIYSAVKAVEVGVIRPTPGDILTFLIWRPPLLLRMQRDWAASPYNVSLHPNTAVNPTGKNPYDHRDYPELQGMAKMFEHLKKAQATGPITYSTSTPDIDHEILVRQTSEGEPDGGFHKRPHTNDDYERAIADIPRRLVQGTKWGKYPPMTLTVPSMPNVQVKLLMIDTVDGIFDYINAGIAPVGPRWITLWDIPDETRMGDMNRFADCAWLAYAEGPMRAQWSPTPSVNRTNVKIKEFHYFGHSGNSVTPYQDALFLSYGVNNAKGTLSQREVVLEESRLDDDLSAAAFSDGASATLWGCSTGRTMAHTLTAFFGSVTACEGLTTYANILDDGETLPEPSDPAYPFNVYLPP